MKTSFCIFDRDNGSFTQISKTDPKVDTYLWFKKMEIGIDGEMRNGFKIYVK